MKKIAGMDVDHAKKVITVLAKYHAFGRALKQKMPDFFEKVIGFTRLKVYSGTGFQNNFKNILEHYKKVCSSHKHMSLIESSFANVLGGDISTDEPREPWPSISHGDLWTSNILFHKNQDGEVDDVKLIDFVCYSYTNPLKDLPYFICTSLNHETQEIHINEILNIYYDTFIGTLQGMNCCIEPFPKEAFNRELKREALNELPVILFVLRFILFKSVEENNNEEVVKNILNSELDESFTKKLLRIIRIYERQGWF